MRKALAFSVAIAWVAVAAGPASSAHPVLSPSSHCQGGWTNSKVPSLPDQSVLYGVTALSRTDVWSVGDSGYQALALHFDGTSWSVVPTPTGVGTLYGVVGLSSDDVWAVGQGGPFGTAVLHWDGIVWSNMPTPSPGPYGGLLLSVAAREADDVWAVGLSYTAPPESGGSATLTEHWDGIGWTIVPSPSAFDNSQLEAVSADSASDVWALGPAEVDRWDGSAWNLVSFSPPSWNKLYLDVAAFGPEDVWVTGWTVIPQTQPTFTHWDGTAWRNTTGPPIPGWGQMFGIGGPSSDRLWAVGQQSTGALMERWDGTSWRVVPAPSPPGSTSAILRDVVVDSQGFGWAVGGSGGWDALIEHTCRT